MNDLTVAEPANVDAIRSRIFTIRGVQVMLAPDLADLYQVETRSFNQSVKRNLKRFPDNFRFQLTKAELDEVITKCDNPDRLRFSPQLPFAFTEQGIAMLSGVLNSDIAIQVSIRIMNTFVAMRRALATLAPLLARIEATERRQLKQEDAQARNEERFKLILDAMQDKRFPPQAEQTASCRRCGEVQRAVRQLAHGQDLRQIPRPLPHHRQNDLDSRRCVPQLPRQEVLCILIPRQVQHP